MFKKTRVIKPYLIGSIANLEANRTHVGPVETERNTTPKERSTLREITLRSPSNERRGKKPRNLYSVSAYDRRVGDRRKKEFEPESSSSDATHICVAIQALRYNDHD